MIRHTNTAHLPRNLPDAAAQVLALREQFFATHHIGEREVQLYTIKLAYLDNLRALARANATQH